MSVFETDETEPLDLAVKLFGPVKVDGSSPPSRSRPDDYPGFESLAVLQTAGGLYKAGKSYRPDPSGLRRAIKVDDYSSGKHFLCTSFLIEGLEDIFDLLKHLSTNPYKFVVRGVLSEYSDVYRQHKITKE